MRLLSKDVWLSYSGGEDLRPFQVSFGWACVPSGRCAGCLRTWLAPYTITVTSDRAEAEAPAQSQIVVCFALSILVSLNPGDDCKIAANAQELELRQVCRMALEDVFFGA